MGRARDHCRSRAGAGRCALIQRPHLPIREDSRKRGVPRFVECSEIGDERVEIRVRQRLPRVERREVLGFS